MTLSENAKKIELNKEAWEKKLSQKSEELQSLANQLDDPASYGMPLPNSQLVSKLKKEFAESKLKHPSEFMREYYSELVELFVGNIYLEDYYYIIDKLTQFSYSYGWERRTVRTPEYELWFYNICELLDSYKYFSFYECSFTDFLSVKMQEEQNYYNDWLYDYKIVYVSSMLAARIDQKDDKLISFIREIILGENNTAFVSTRLISGIIKSSNDSLHTLLTDFLLAARLQEGVRQAICEHADEGTISAFIKIFDTIYNNNLIRFSSVKRAIAVWTGLYDWENAERISDKTLRAIHDALHDYPHTALEYVKTNDSILIMCGLWVLGFYDVNNAISVMDEYIKNGTRNQLLTMGYYNTLLQYRDYSYKTASKIVKTFSEDYELIAVFMPSFLDNAASCVQKATEYTKCKEIQLEQLYPNKSDAYSLYKTMKNICDNIPNKTLDFYPVVFSWYGASINKSDLIIRMCATAYALKDDELIDDACNYLNSISVASGGYTMRYSALKLLTHDPRTQTQRKTLLQAIIDKESYTRKTAFEILNDITLTSEEYIILEGYLKYKSNDTRRYILTLLEKQSYNEQLSIVSRLLLGKSEELRMGGLSLLQDIKQHEAELQSASLKEKYDTIIENLPSLSNITERENLIIQKLCGTAHTFQISNDKTLDLYDENVICTMPERKTNYELFRKYFMVSLPILDEAFANLRDFYKAHELLEYTAADGETKLLANGLFIITFETKPIQDKFPFKELWIEFYEAYIKSPALITQMLLALDLDETKISKDQEEIYHQNLNDIFGAAFNEYCPLPTEQIPRKQMLQQVLQILNSIYPDPNFGEVSKEVLNYICCQINEDALWYHHKSISIPISLISGYKMRLILDQITYENDKEFEEYFCIFYDLDRRFKNNEHNYANSYTGYHMCNYNYLDLLDYIKARTLNLISDNEIYKVAFETFSLEFSLQTLSEYISKNLVFNEKTYSEKTYSPEIFSKTQEIYNCIMTNLLEIELRRGDMPARYSNAVFKAKLLYGTEKLVAILAALGNDKLNRNYYYDGPSKKNVLCHLLTISYPNPNDNADLLSKLLHDTKIPEKRLYEVIMYAPQWIDIIQEYLGKDLKSGCYYFMAHMATYFDDKKKAIIAKYTPLSTDELNDGAFDVQWFQSSYHTLGKETFDYLYDAAKYISDGSKHSRARKYADAALGKISINDLEAQIQKTRNKDSLMSYGIIPLSGAQDILHRYEFIEQFRKESNQFGSQRRASEKIACDMAIKNLSTNAGYQDVTRLILAMENKMSQKSKDAFEEHIIGEFSVKLSTNPDGKIEIKCSKGDTLLKSIPATLKKDEYVLYLKETQKKLREQYSRTVKMFEQAMENQEIYFYNELKSLTTNPVIAPMIKSLVYITCDLENQDLGILSENGLTDYKKQTIPLEENTRLRIAHPFDLYKSGYWDLYQSYLFDEISVRNIIRQPFKQVFRELYLKLDEEKNAYSSMRFAGNQIQPQKTVACLKSRYWVADFSEGLQKVYYKENIIAKIYALADWFSPSDIEAPTLEYVEFYNRETFKSLYLKDIPDIIYSEVMRDVDLAISVAHVGGVDPETSHSTIEMRKVIISHNLPLFKLTNVTFDDTHAIIEGKLGRYSIHIGSGVIHKIGSHQINVLPVHSQSRGKIFLPFIDEDPKTAEIMSKIVLFAQDQKIKDPYILNQLR